MSSITNLKIKVNPEIITLLVINIIAIFASFVLLNYSLSGRILDITHGGAFYDMYKRLIHGDVSISPDALHGERFIINGKYIPYELPYPALLRGLLSLVGLGKVPLPELMLSIIIYNLSIYYLFKELIIIFSLKDKNEILKWYPFFILPMFTLLVNQSIYYEDKICSLAIFTLQCFLFLYSERKISSQLSQVMFFACSGLVLFTRPTYLVASGVLVLFKFLLNIKFYIKNHKALIPYSIFCCAFIALLVLNEKRWGNPFEFGPYEKYEQATGYRGHMAIVSPKLSLMRIPDTFKYYIIPNVSNFKSSYPYIDIDSLWFKTSTFSKLNPKVYYDYIEPALPVTLIFPFSILLCLIAILKVREVNLNKYSESWKLSALVISCAIPVLIIHLCMFMALRYRSELYSLITILSMLGLCRIYQIEVVTKYTRYFYLIFIFSFILIINGLSAEKTMIERWIADVPKTWQPGQNIR